MPGRDVDARTRLGDRLVPIGPPPYETIVNLRSNCPIEGTAPSDADSGDRTRSATEGPGAREMMRNRSSLVLFRTSVVGFVAVSLALTAVAIAEQVPYRFGGSGTREEVPADAFAHGTGISAPIVFLVVFAVLLALTWLPGRWKAVPLFLGAIAATIGLGAGIAEIPLGSGPFTYPIGPLAVALWFVSIAAAAGIMITGILAGISSSRDSTHAGAGQTNAASDAE